MTGEEPAGAGARRGFWQRHRDKFVAEIERNRQRGHRVPAWLLVVAHAAYRIFHTVLAAIWWPTIPAPPGRVKPPRGTCGTG